MVVKVFKLHLHLFNDVFFHCRDDIGEDVVQVFSPPAVIIKYPQWVLHKRHKSAWKVTTRNRIST